MRGYGKWHVGEGPGRWPTDKGFEEWYGPPRTYDEALWPTDPWYDPKRDPVSAHAGDQTRRGRRHRGRPAHARCPPRLRRRVPAPRGGVHARSVEANTVLRLLQPLADAHAGDPARGVQGHDRTGRLGRQPARARRATSACCSTCSTNWASPTTRWSCSRATTAPRTCCCGAARPATGRAPTSPAARATCARRASCAGLVTSRPAGRATTSCTSPTGSPRCCARPAAPPADRVIDGVDQLDWLTGADESSARDGYLYWMGRRCTASNGATSSSCSSPRCTCRTRREAADAAPHQPLRRPARARARHASPPALVGRDPLQPHHRSVRGERPRRAADPGWRAARPRSRPNGLAKQRTTAADRARTCQRRRSARTTCPHPCLLAQ